MDVLDRSKVLYSNLEKINEELEHVTETLKTLDPEKDFHMYEELYSREFFLAMEMAGAYDDLDNELNKLFVEPGYQFYAKRMRSNVSKIMKVSIIDV